MHHNFDDDESSEVLLYDFEKSKEKKEKEKIQFNNNFYNSLENNEFFDIFFKTNIKYIKYSNLKFFNGIHSKIYNFDNINYN